MKIALSSLIATFAIAYSSSQCMQPLNNNIGPIDKLMLEHAIKEKGYNTLAQEIENHAFTQEIVLEKILPVYTTENYPFSIMHQCRGDDCSVLSKTVFNKINLKNIVFISKNPLNLNQNSLDECTTWKRITDSDDVQVTTDFYDKAVLVALLNQLKK